MEGMIQQLMNIAAIILRLYSMILVIRLILTWFAGTRDSSFTVFLSRITDPYLDWWRRNFPLRVGILDFSPVAAILALSVAQTICFTIASQGRISIGIILAVILSALWSAASFILGFCFIILVLRLFAYMTNSNMYSPFWQVIDAISRPLLYRINRIFFGRKITGYMTSILISLVLVGAAWVAGRFVMQFLAGLLMGLPL